MEHAQTDGGPRLLVQLVEQRHERGAGAVELPVAGEDAAVLVAVAVAQHHILLGARACHQGLDAGQGVEGTHDGRGIAQVLDGLEQRHDDQVAGGVAERSAVPPRASERPLGGTRGRASAGRWGAIAQGAAQQADLLLQQQRLEQVAHRLGVADDVVADRRRAVARAGTSRGREDRELALRERRIGGVGNAQRACVVQQAQEQCLLGFLGQRRVIGLDARGGQQLGDHGLMLVGALAQVHRGEMEAEHLDCADQRPEALAHQGRAVLVEERFLDGAQVCQEFLGMGIGVLRRDRMARCLTAAEFAQRRRQARVDAGERPAVGFVLAVLAVVGRALCQRLHLHRHVHQRRRQRQLAAKVVHLGQVVAQRQLGLAAHGVLEALGRHVGIAVAVAADPLAHAQERRDVAAAQGLFELGVDARDLAQEGGLVVAQRILDLVGHGELGEAQQPRLPELEHARAQAALVLRHGDRRQRVPGTGEALLAQLDVVALGQQLRDGTLGIEDALALHFRRMGSEHRRYVAVRQRLHHRCGRDARLPDARERHLQAAGSVLALALGLGAAADLVPVLGQVCQVAEVGEGADHAHGLGRAQSLEEVLERAVGCMVGVAPEGDGERADLLYQRERFLALLFADHVAEDASEQADVVDQRLFVAVAALGG
ncbi:hypothetical protein APY03_3276 [Variovorax sp. WDL1]|nr:hypothetical protein APY03_3276 [Variovorax sp. WDL1]